MARTSPRSSALDVERLYLAALDPAVPCDSQTDTTSDILLSNTSGNPPEFPVEFLIHFESASHSRRQM